VGRLHILGEMAKALDHANAFSVHAPRIETMQIPTDKIREVIGSGGKVIREIVELSGPRSTSTTTAPSRSRPRTGTRSRRPTT
jgi:polyribonucleotide nucleotidyltransferase